MPFRGELQDFRLPEVLQMIATTGKSGRLVLTRRNARGLLIFRRGRIVYAASDSLRETLGSLLVSEGLLGEERLARALELQRRRQGEVRLGLVLVEEGWLSEEQLEEAVTRQVERVVADLGSWTRGFFEFTQMPVPSRGEVPVDAPDLLLAEGLAPDHVLLSIAVQLDEAARDGVATEAMPNAAGLFELAAADAGAEDQPAEVRLAAIKEVLSQVRSPRLTGEVTALLLANAARLVRRAVLFAVHAEVFRGLAQRGLEPALAAAVGELKIPLADEGILRRAAASRGAVRGRLSAAPGDERLRAGLGAAEPAEAIAVPVTVGDKVRLVLYGDNHPAGEPIAATDELELVLLQTGAAMERAALAERVQQLEFEGLLASRG